MPPRIPIYNEQQVAPRPLASPYQSANVTDAAFGVTAGRELAQAGERVGNILLREAALDNEARARELDVAFNREQRALLFDPANGYFAKKGKDALDAYQPAADAIDKLKARYIAMAANPDQARILADVLSRRVEMTTDSMSRHATVQRAGWLAATSEARAADARSDAIAYFNDPDKLRLFLANGTREIAESVRLQGLGDDVAAIRIKQWRSDTLKGVLAQIMTDDPVKAAAWFEANGIAGKNVGQVIAIARKRMGEDAASEPGPGPEPRREDVYREMEAQLPRDATPEQRERYRRVAESVFVERHAIWKERGDRALEVAYGWIERNPGKPIDAMPEPMLRGLDFESRAKLARYIKARGEVVTDQARWYELQKMAIDEPTRFAQLNLLHDRDRLSPSDFQEMARLQGKVKQGDPDKDLTQLRTANELVNEYLRNVGVDPNAKPGSNDEKRGNFLRRLYQEELTAFERQKGKKADPAEQQAILDRLTVKLPTGGRNWRGLIWLDELGDLGARSGSSGGPTREPMRFTIGDVPKDHREVIEKKLRERGMPVTDDAIVSLYVRFKLMERQQ